MSLAICVRCHIYPLLVLDTIDSIFYYATTNPIVMLASDWNSDIAPFIQKHYPQVYAYNTEKRMGWGSGLFHTLCESIHYLQGHTQFDAFLSLDYDNLPIRRGFDEKLLERVSTGAGLIGNKKVPAKHWEALVSKHKQELEALHMPDKYESVLGSLMLLTPIGLRTSESKGYFRSPYREVCGMGLPDDLWLSLLIQSAGLEIGGVDDIAYNVWGHPEDYRKIHKEGKYLYHPTKGEGGGKPLPESKEYMCRNYFRSVRKKSPL